jgi:hypothetical protein
MAHAVRFEHDGVAATTFEQAERSPQAGKAGADDDHFGIRVRRQRREVGNAGRRLRVEGLGRVSPPRDERRLPPGRASRDFDARRLASRTRK